MVARLCYASLVAIGAYAVVALVAFPEGNPSPLARLVGLIVIAAVTAAAIAVARWAPAWVRGLGMLVVGFATVAVLAGVVAERVLRAPPLAAVLGLVAWLGGICLVVAGWSHLLRGLRRRWIRAVMAVVGTLLVANRPGATCSGPCTRPRPRRP